MNDFGWDLPPGVSESDIPGNRPEDERWDLILGQVYDMTPQEVLRKLNDHAPDLYEELLEEARKALTEILFDEGRD